MVAPLGVTLSFLDDFIESHGGFDVFATLTTRDVNLQFLQPLTASSQLSLVDQLTVAHADVLPARYYVSHAWPYLFVDVVESLHVFFSDKPSADAVVWLDLFCNSQHANTDFASLTRIISSAIGAIQRVVMVLLPWDRPIPLTRAWCVYEVYVAVASRSHFDVAMTEAETNRFTAHASVESFFDMLGHVKSEASESYDPSDKAQIVATIHSTIGFRDMDTMVFRVFENWMTSTLLAKVDATPQTLGRSNWRFKLGSLYHVQGKYDLAEAAFDACVSARLTLLGGDHPETLSAQAHLARTYKAQGKYAIAATLLRQCHDVSKRTGQEESPTALLVLDTLAATHQCLGQYGDAEALFESCLTNRRRTLGDAHQSTMVTMGNLASLYQAQGKYELAAPLYERCLAASIASVGHDNPNTLILRNNVAVNKSALHDYASAEVLYAQCLSDSERILGPDHPSTLATMNNLAATYYHQRKLEVAETLYTQCLGACQRVLGDTHPQTLSAMNNLAALLKDAAKLDDAEKLYLKCVAANTNVMGACHPQTLTSMSNLAILYDRQGKLVEATSLLVPCLARRRDVLPPDHPSLIHTIRELGWLFEKQKDFAAAQPLLAEYVELQGRRVGSPTNDVLQRKCSLAECYTQTKNLPAAEMMLLECVAGAKCMHGEAAPETLKIVAQLEDFYVTNLASAITAKDWTFIAHYRQALESFGKTNVLSDATKHQIESSKHLMPVGTPRKVIKSLIVSPRAEALQEKP
ncbi:hypothetical protein SDRG_16916 [Saprolegnia diclina VS20]|uniref:Mbre TPR repeat protein n=1 Tax=Saprolegnia diclina (strain VS20) TaxID=1156394 RepID=T0PIL6_SAPDV|nr:hypothetical protein SDRG_16916 [Saprolegnia diclina VS20]EQC25219.1 hypothetical protein SDRG_16916 [Saprolegnia diclina VS20]|eukprot:XP_008621363.1 hypothetical protein SDRG_16916 [Saprolegnia diclina VS20]